MSSTTTHPPAGPSSPFPYPPPHLPAIEQLYQMTSVPEERVVIRDVDWAFYEQLVDSIPPGANIHADYDGKDVELMSLSGFHDVVKKRMGRFAELVAEDLEIPCTGLGQTTWKRADRSRPGGRRMLLFCGRQAHDDRRGGRTLVRGCGRLSRS